MKQLFAVAVPISPEKVNDWNSFMNELNGPRKAAFKASRDQLGVRERTFHQSTPMGDFVLVTLEGENPQEAFASFGQGKDEFTKWFVDQVKQIHGMDLSAPPQGVLPKLIIDSGV